MQDPLFCAVIFVVAVFGGAVAALSGFGIGSVLTSLLATTMSMKAAVAVVSIPHVAATAAGLWGLRKHIDRRVLIHFGICSAAGGLASALLQSKANSPVLTEIFGASFCLQACRVCLAGWIARDFGTARHGHRGSLRTFRWVSWQSGRNPVGPRS